jgi:hypothetical protein
MLGEGSKKSRYLFEVELEAEEVEALVALEPDLLKGFILRCGRVFKKHIRESEGATLFLNNYRQIMELHSAVVSNTTSVDLCVHFALLYSQLLIL